MFGYIKVDEPYLYKKDEVLYDAMYCGLCKGIGLCCSQSARFTLTYDLTFFSAFAHNVLDVDVKLEKQRCVAHLIKKRMMAKPDSLTEKIGAVNVLLAWYKLQDNIYDEKKGGIAQTLIKRGYKKARQICENENKIIEKHFMRLREMEKSAEKSVDKVSDAFGKMLEELAESVIGSSAETTGKLFYFLGKWIYLIDALDDFDKDIKKKNYNVFSLCYDDSKDFFALLKAHGEELIQIFNGVFYNIKACYDATEFKFNKDLIENILLRGIPQQTAKIFSKKNRGANNG